MSESNSRSHAPMHMGFVWGGTVARVHRGGKSNRSSTGRRSALLGLMTSMYANTARGSRTTSEARQGVERP